MSRLLNLFWANVLAAARPSPNAPSAAAHHQSRPVADQDSIVTTVTTNATSGTIHPMKRYSARRSNSGVSSRTAIASMTSSTSGRYRSVRLTETTVNSEPSTTPASSSDSVSFIGGAPGRANDHTPCALKSKPASTSGGVSSRISASTDTVSST